MTMALPALLGCTSSALTLRFKRESTIAALHRPVAESGFLCEQPCACSKAVKLALNCMPRDADMPHLAVQSCILLVTF